MPPVVMFRPLSIKDPHFVSFPNRPGAQCPRSPCSDLSVSKILILCRSLTDLVPNAPGRHVQTSQYQRSSFCVVSSQIWCPMPPVVMFRPLSIKDPHFVSFFNRPGAQCPRSPCSDLPVPAGGGRHPARLHPQNQRQNHKGKTNIQK